MIEKLFAITAAVLFFLCPQVACHSPASEVHTPKFETIAHEMLRIEHALYSDAENLSGLNERMRLLDDVIHLSISNIGTIESNTSDCGEILSAFNAIDHILAHKHFIIWVPTDTLYEGLAEREPKKEGWLLLTRMRRLVMMHTEDKSQYKHIDCDTGAFIYMAIFEELGLPVVLVDSPRHKFLRWRINDNEYINWDVNDAASYTDQEYREGVPLSTYPFSREIENESGYLLDMSRLEVTVYHRSVLALAVARDNGDIEAAYSLYQEALGLSPRSADVCNYFAWFIALTESLQSLTELDFALRLALIAVELEPSDSHKDTLAAVYAARREFDKAVETEQGGAGNKVKIAVYRAGRTPVEAGWAY